MVGQRNFPEVLKDYRKARGLTQDRLAKEWNYSIDAISAWERGVRTPGGLEVPRIAELLGITPESLVEVINGGSGRSQKSRNSLGSGEMEGLEKRDQSGAGKYSATMYRDRTVLERDYTYTHLFETSREIVVTGISLNAIALHYSREAFIRAIVENNSAYTLCFLDPDGPCCAARGQEEGLPEGYLPFLVRFNIANVLNIRNDISKRDAEAAERLQIMIYDLPPRFSIYLFDDRLMTMQFYAYGRGQDTPCFALERQSQNDLFEYYASTVRYILAQSRPITIE